MWWHFVKLNENDSSITYAFGYESRNTTGIFEYDKKKAIITKDFDGDTTYYEFDLAILQLIEDYGAPDKKTIAYG